jgi:hypothetical protein
MDYNPLSVALPGAAQGDYVTQTIGPYDYWAIEYGYKPVEKDEELKAVAARVAEKGLAYATDEDTWSPDPLVNRFDLGSDPLEYARQRMDLAVKLMPTIIRRVVADGEGYQRARRALDMLLFEHMRSASVAGRFIGGQYIHRDHKGDPNGRPPLVPVEAAKQRDALRFVCDRIFAEGAIEVPKELLGFLAAGRWSHWGTNDFEGDVNYPIHDRILAIQRTALSTCLDPERLDQVLDAEVTLGSGAEVFTLPELFDTLTQAIFTEVGAGKGAKGAAGAAAAAGPAGKKPLISSVRRNLQRAYLERLVNMAVKTRYGMAPQVVRALACRQLEQIGERIGTVTLADLDGYTSAHLEEAAHRIKKALDASYQVQGEQSGGGMIIILRGQEGKQ